MTSVQVRMTICATHLGEYQGIPATGKTVTLPTLTYSRVVNDQMIEDHPIINEPGCCNNWAWCRNTRKHNPT